jgi:hypothetical protein
MERAVNHIDIYKIWAVNSATLISNRLINVLTDWNEVIQGGLTTILLLASIGYTLYKLLNERDKRKRANEDQH